MLRQRGGLAEGQERPASVHWFTADQPAGLRLLTGVVVSLVCWSWSGVFPAVVVPVGAATTTNTRRYKLPLCPQDCSVSERDLPVLAERAVAPVGRPGRPVPVVLAVRGVAGGGVRPGPRTPVVVLTSP